MQSSIYVLMYLKDDKLFICRLNREKIGEEEYYPTTDELDISARKRRDILIHKVSSDNPAQILYLQTISLAPPKATVTGTPTAEQFIQMMRQDQTLHHGFIDGLSNIVEHAKAAGQFDIVTNQFS